VAQEIGVAPLVAVESAGDWQPDVFPLSPGANGANAPPSSL
jgi:hypothetical protein